MTLRTSSNKKLNPAFNMFKYTLKRNIGVLLLITACALLLSPGYAVMYIKETLKNLGYSRFDIKNLMTVLTYVGTAAGCVISVIFNIINFSFIFQKKSVDVFLSFPMTRFELISSRFFASLVLSEIPVVVGYLGLLGILLFYPAAVGSVATLSVYLVYAMLSVLICSSFSLIFLVCAGNAFDFVISFFGINLGVFGMALMLEYILNQTLYGYSDLGADNIVLKFCSPFAFIIRGFTALENSDVKNKTVLFIVKSILLSLAFYIVSGILFKYRKSEKSGESYAYRFIYVICSLILGICGAFLIGTIFSGKVDSFKFIITAAIGAVLTSVGYGAISNRGFKTVKKSLILGAAASVVIFAVITVCHFDLFGYVSKVPDNSSVETVKIRFSGLNSVEFKNPEIITKLHKAIVEKENIERVKENNDGDNIVIIHLTYTLKNGRELKRNYNVVTNALSDEILSIYKSDEFENKIRSISDRKSIVGANISYNEKNSYIPLSKEDYQLFLNTYFKDLKVNGDKRLVSGGIYNLNVTLTENSDSRDYNGEYYYNLPLSDELTETKKLLDLFLEKYKADIEDYDTALAD